MRKLTSIASVVMAGLFIVGCSSSDKDIKELPSQDLYGKGQNYLQEEDYSSAIRYLEAVDGQFKQGNYGEQTQLSLIYAYYKTGEYYKALDGAERFVRTYPNSASMDYVYYLAGLSNSRLGDNFIQDLFRVNRSSRAIENVRNAFGSFRALVETFPNSQYAQDAQNRMAYLRNRLAEHELAITRFYMNREAYVAAANRVEEMIRYYPDTKATNDALPLLQKAFEQMGLADSAQKTAELIKANEGKTFTNVSRPEYDDKF